MRLTTSLFSILFLTLELLSTTLAETDQPNIVYIISDDQAWTDYGFMGHPDIKTPNLDRLASRSALFRRGYVPTALCRPSLATLATGLYASEHGVTGNDPAKRPGNADVMPQLRQQLISKLPASETLASLLGEEGYLSHQSGKWWEGSYRHGGFTHGMTRGFPQPGGRHGDDGLKIGREGMQPVFDFVDESIEKKKPFFLWYAPFLPHTPHTPPARLLNKYTTPGRPPRLARYYAMCEWFDETCGELLDYLDSKNLTDNTLVVYVTDNGWVQRTEESIVPKGWTRQFAPRSKQSPNEAGVRTPIMLSWPGRIQPGERSEVVSSIDLYPTILAAVEIKTPDGRSGLNLLPVINDGEKLEREHIFGETFAHDIIDLDNPQTTLLYRWVIQDRWKLILRYDGTTTRYKAVHSVADPAPQLFDLIADPHEETNVAADHPRLVAQLVDHLTDWWTVDERQVQLVP